MNNKPLLLGILAVVSPIPMLLVTAFWNWICFFVIGLGLLHLDTVPQWLLFCSLFPLLISPGCGIVGVMVGILHRKEPRAGLGILLSVLGIALNVLLFYGMYAMGNRF